MADNILKFPTRSGKPRPPTDACAPYYSRTIIENDASLNIVATLGAMATRVRVISPAEDWIITLPPPSHEWAYGTVLAALKPFAWTRMAEALIISTLVQTKDETCVETWTLLRNGSRCALSISCSGVGTPHFDCHRLDEPALFDAPPIVLSIFGWFCSDKPTREITQIHLDLMRSVFSSGGIWSAFYMEGLDPPKVVS